MTHLRSRRSCSENAVPATYVEVMSDEGGGHTVGTEVIDIRKLNDELQAVSRAFMTMHNTADVHLSLRTTINDVHTANAEVMQNGVVPRLNTGFHINGALPICSVSFIGFVRACKAPGLQTSLASGGRSDAEAVFSSCLGSADVAMAVTYAFADLQAHRLLGRSVKLGRSFTVQPDLTSRQVPNRKVPKQIR